MLKLKKIASALAGFAMVGATIGMAAATTYPQPFVSSSGAADVAIVYGSHPAATVDLAGAVRVQESLNTFATSTGGTTTPTGGDSVMLSKGTDKFNLGNGANSFFTSMDEDQLSTMLAPGSYLNDQNEEFDYTQKLQLGSWNNLTHFQDNEFNDDEPTIGFALANGDHVLNYTLDFEPDAAEGGTGFADLETTKITLLGREYSILDAGTTSGDVYLTLLDAANTALVSEGETETLVIGTSTYEVSAQVFSSTQVILTVNGERTNTLNEGQTQRLSGDTYVGISDILYVSKETGVSSVEFSIGTGKLELRDGEEVKLNNEDISQISDSEIKAYITNSSTDIEQIVLQWNVKDDHWIAPGSELVMPGFEAIKLSMTEFVTDASEMTKLEPKNDYIQVRTTVADGEVAIPFLYYNGTDFSLIGKSSDERLVTSSTAEIIYDSTDSAAQFVATWYSGDDAESYVLEVSDIDDTTPAKNTTTIRSVAAGSSRAVTLDIGETDDIGEVAFTLNAASEVTGVVNVTISAAGGSGTVSTNKIITAEGLKIQLPYNSTAAGDGAINFTAGDVNTWNMNFTEETKDGDINQGSSLKATVAASGNSKTTVSTITEGVLSGGQDFETSDGSDDWVGYVNSDLATMTLYRTGGDEDSLDLTYHGTEAYAAVYVAENGVSFNGDGAVSVPVLDTESSMYAGKNLVVVGGSCVNTVAATLLGSSAPLCGAEFTDKTGVTSGQYLIQSFDRSGKVATLVAGYNAADTNMAATAFTTQTVDTTVGTKYTGSTVDNLEPVITTA